MTIILGIDPGSRITGFGVIESDGRTHRYIESGTISSTSKIFSKRLQIIFRGIDAVMQEYQPDEVGVEDIFMHVNPMGALKLGQARGAAICAAAQQDAIIAEYTARQIKQAIVGYGAAQKAQVQHMVIRMLNLKIDLASDAADALAVALCHAHTRSGLEALKRAGLERQ